MNVIDTAIEDLKAAIETVEPIRDGWRDLDRAITVRDDGAPASFQCGRAVAAYDERLRLLHLAWATLEELKADGYPDRLVIVMRPEVESVIADNGRTIMAALTTLRAEGEAVSATVYLGEPIPRKE